MFGGVEFERVFLLGVRVQTAPFSPREKVAEGRMRDRPAVDVEHKNREVIDLGYRKEQQHVTIESSTSHAQ